MVAELVTDASGVRVLNPDGAAEIVLLCDHATNRIPDGYDNLGLSAADLERHIAWDIGAEEITRRLCKLLDAPAVLAGVSRLLVDCNRFPHEPTFIVEVSDGIPIPGNRNLDEAERHLRLETYWQPYHAACDQVIDKVLARGIRPLIVSVHSFTPVMAGQERPWHIGFMWNKDPRLAHYLITQFEREELFVGRNEPYSGADWFGTVKRHGEERGLLHTQAEICQNDVKTAADQDFWAERLAKALVPVMRDQGRLAR